MLGSGKRVNLAGPGKRLGARIIDSLPLFLLAGVFSADLLIKTLDFIDSSRRFGIYIDDSLPVAFDIFYEPFKGAFITAFVFWELVWGPIEVAMIANRGQTPGKMLVKVKVVRVDSGGLPGVGKSIGRWVVLTTFPVAYLWWHDQAAGVLVIVASLWMLCDRNRQGFHDKAAGTLVIRDG